MRNLLRVQSGVTDHPLCNEMRRLSLLRDDSEKRGGGLEA